MNQDKTLPENKHLGRVESEEPVGLSCPICETLILRLRAEGRIWLACDCMAEEYCEEGELEDEDYPISGESWGEEVLDTMRWHADKFPPGSIPGSNRLRRRQPANLKPRET
jgi:hypothetical protein